MDLSKIRYLFENPDRTSVIVALRHVERDKNNKDDPQTPTKGGELAAYAMGMELRPVLAGLEMTVISSPQPRAIRTAELVRCGITGWHEPLTTVLRTKTDPRLDDYSSDQREVVKVGLAAAKKFAAQHGIEVEQALFLTREGREAIQEKHTEFQMMAIEDCMKPGGVYLLCGLHGATIDAAYAHNHLWLSGWEGKPVESDMVPDSGGGMGLAGGMFDKVEGWVAAYNEETRIIGLAIIRQPAYLKTLATVLK